MSLTYILGQIKSVRPVMVVALIVWADPTNLSDLHLLL